MPGFWTETDVEGRPLRDAAGLVPLAEVKAVLESARDAYSDHPGLSDRPEYQAATQVVTTDFFRDLMTALETRFGEGKP